MINNKFKYKGKVKIEDLVTGVIKEYENVVTIGFYVKASRLITGVSVDTIGYIGFGDSQTTPAESDTTLGNQVGSRLSIDSSSVDSTTGEIEIIVDVAGGQAVFNWYELGLFDASSGGVMTNRVSTDYDHTTGNDTRVTWTISKA